MFDRLKRGLNKLIKKLTIKELNEKSLQKPVAIITNFMIQNEVGSLAAMQIGKELKYSLINHEHKRFSDVRTLVRNSLRQSVIRILSPENINYDVILQAKKKKELGEPFVIVFLGINGTGKTTTLAKFGKLFKENKLSVVFSAGDTFRAGAIDQISKHGTKLKIKTIKSQYGGDASAVAIDSIDHALAKDINVVLIDTAGRMQNNDNLVRELEKIVRVAEPDLRLFIGDALTGNDLIRQAQVFQERVGFDAIVLTKMDADVKGGAAISVSFAAKCPILFYCDGQGYNDLKKFKPKEIAKQIIP